MSIQTTTVRAGEFAFTVDTAGPADGAPVLLLHGFPETRHMWRHQLEALATAGCRAIAPDQRGYSSGARPQDVFAYTTDNLIADALGIMDALDHARFHLVGHDWGGQLAWLIAAAHPQRLLSLSILSRPHPAAFVRAMQEDTQQANRSGHHRAFREPDAVARMREAKLKPLRDALIRQQVPADATDTHIAQLLEPGAIEGAMNWYRATGFIGDTPKIATPTFYVWGTEDATVGRRAAELTAEYVTGPYRFVVLEGGTHFTPDQMPDRVSALLLEHIKAH